MDVETAQTKELVMEEAPCGIKADVSLTWQSHTLLRPSSASSFATPPQRPQRPQSAASLPVGGSDLFDRRPARVLRRPLSACSFSSAGIVKIPHETNECAQRRPASACSLPDETLPKSRSRPSSANSIAGRFAAIQENLQKNRALMQANRKGIDGVVKKRQESALLAREALAKELENRATSTKLLED